MLLNQRTLFHRFRSLFVWIFFIISLMTTTWAFRHKLPLEFHKQSHRRNALTTGVHRLSSSVGSFSLDVPRNIAIVGGGLAGLSTAFHFLQKQQQQSPGGAGVGGGSVTIFDRAPVGQGGASAVAGGLVHPLSPRGKLVHLGIECLETTRQMVDCAVQATAAGAQEHSTADNSRVILCDEIMRLALNEKQVAQLTQTAEQLPELCQWMDASELQQQRYTTKSGGGCTSVLGGLRLAGSGCMVLHVPSYLKGLWIACEKMASEMGMSATWNTTCQDEDDLLRSIDWKSYDAVILAAGAGLIQEDILGPGGDLPVQLVRGQSVELRQNCDDDDDDDDHTNQNPPLQSALLAGKYVSPLPGSGILVGATHEFKKEAMSFDEVVATLQEATSSFYPWKIISVERVTEGFRVQSQRGKYGRQPIVGRYTWPHHENTYIFTGLSSRGLLHHGYYGSALVDVMMGRPSSLADEQFDWWRQSMKQ